MRNELLVLDNTQRHWRAVLETCLSMYEHNGVTKQVEMAGFAKMAFMLITA